MSYYFDDIMRVQVITFSDILLGKKSYKTYQNILIYDISHKTFTGSKPLRISFDEIDGFNEIYEIYNEIYDRIRYLISEESGITDLISHNFARIRIDSYNSLPKEKTFTFHNVIIFINKNRNDYYYNIFLEKGSYKDKSNTQYF